MLSGMNTHSAACFDIYNKVVNQTKSDYQTIISDYQMLSSDASDYQTIISDNQKTPGRVLENIRKVIICMCYSLLKYVCACLWCLHHIPVDPSAPPQLVLSLSLKSTSQVSKYLRLPESNDDI